MTATAATPRSEAIALAVVVLAIFCVPFVLYWPGLNGGFVFDDFQNLLDNPALRMAPGRGGWLDAAFSSPASELQRPLSMLSFALNHYFTGFDGRAMKLTNIAIHAMNAVIAFFLVRKIVRHAAPGRDPLPVAALTAFAWAVHPINLMAVLYVIQRMESLSHTFVLVGLICYCIGRERMWEHRNGWPWLLFALVACPLLGVTAKESAVLLPLYALVLELVLWRFKATDGRGHRRLQFAFMLLLVLPALAGGGWLLSRALSPGAFGARDFGPWERLLSEGRILLDYLHWTVVPDLSSLSLFHDDYRVSRSWLDPPSTLPAWFVVLSLLPLGWLLRKRRPLTTLGLGWFLCAHVITASFVSLDLAYEHRNYFASLGICLAIADLLLLAPDSAKRRQFGAAVALSLVLLLSLTTRLRATEWSNPLRFAESEAAKHPDSPRSTYEAARMLVIAGEYDPASPYTRRALPALDRALAVRGSNALPAQAALMLAARTGQPMQERWWRHLREQMAMNPGAPENQLSLIALTHCSNSGLCRFPVDQMLSTFMAGLEHDNPGVLSTYGNYARNTMGDNELALRAWREAARLEPRNAQFQRNLAELATEMGRFEDAQAAIDRLRQSGRFGQFAEEAGRRQELLDRARAAASRASGP